MSTFDPDAYLEQASFDPDSYLSQTPAVKPASSMVDELGRQVGRQIGLTARAGITGLTAIPSAMADFLTGAGSAVTGKAIKPSSQALQEFLTQVGLPEPTGRLERAVQAGAGAMAGTGAQVAATQGIPALSLLAANPLQQVAASGAGGVAGQPVSEIMTKATDSPLAGIVAGLVTGTIAGAGASTATSKIGQPSVKPVTINDIKTRASESYAAVKNQGVDIKPKSVLDMLNNAENALVGENFNPKLDTHKPVATVLEQLRDMVGTQKVSFTKLEQMRSAATALRTSNEKATSNYAKQLVNEIDNYINSLNGKDLIASQGSLSEAVRNVQSARKDWRNVSKADILQDALNVAKAKDLDPKASESELIRRQLINLVANKKLINQFSEREQNAIKSVAKGRASDPLLSLISRFNPARNQLITGGAAMSGFYSPETLKYTLPIGAAGLAADKYQGFARGQDLRNLISNVAGGVVPPPKLPNYWSQGMLSGATQPENINRVPVPMEFSEEEMRARQ